jgi:hypothetical protein
MREFAGSSLALDFYLLCEPICVSLRLIKNLGIHHPSQLIHTFTFEFQFHSVPDEVRAQHPSQTRRLLFCDLQQVF